MQKLSIAKEKGKPIDGHCPGLRGKALKKYVDAGINTEHECTSLEEAEEKLSLGMKIMIREGTSAKNMHSLIDLDSERCFLVSDDISAEDLVEGHVNRLLRKAVSFGKSSLEAIKMASLNPVMHYKLGVGLLQVGDPADFVVVKDLKNFEVLETWIEGKKVAEKGKTLFAATPLKIESTFRIPKKKPEDFKVRANRANSLVKIRVIVAIDREIIT